MRKQDYKGAEKDAFRKLEALPKELCYHNLEHTRDVLGAIGRLSPYEGVKEDERLLLDTAALYHDTGYLYCPRGQGHEETSVRIAKSALPTFGYNGKDIDKISGIIRATKMPQKPRTKLQEIIADADLDNIGRDDFFDMGALLRKELEEQGIKMSDKEWYEGTLKLLEKHHYFTDSAIRLRQEGKEQHIAEIKELLRR